MVSALKHSLLQVLSFKPAGVLLGTCGPPGEPGVMLREGMTYDNRGKWQYSGPFIGDGLRADERVPIFRGLEPNNLHLTQSIRSLLNNII